MKTAQFLASVIVPAVLFVTGVSVYIYTNSAKKAAIEKENSFLQNCKDLKAKGFTDGTKVEIRVFNKRDLSGKINFEKGAIMIKEVKDVKQDEDSEYLPDLVFGTRKLNIMDVNSHGEWYLSHDKYDPWITVLFKETDENKCDNYHIKLSEDGKKGGKQKSRKRINKYGIKNRLG